ncbi:hypothetical protein ANCDUO_07623 [Ancylostoma duodenale]|uniref:Uncharacterized protein n=1 Tax=Ancylostoma duodenale TaxID=51022 RepID=A0A0C2GY70_9BILA|nr:hypothetical protein ANCDUO_07623 [Ancylostoma duodenale]
MSAQDYLFNLGVQQFAQQFYAANLLLAQDPEQLYRHHNVLSVLQNRLQLPYELYSVPAQAIPAAAVQAPPPVLQESPGTAAQPVRLFRGEMEMARDNGLSALVGDGTHKLNPITIPDRMDKEQLYTVHAVVRGGVEIPILYAITRHKNIVTYRTIFRRLRKIIGERPGLRIVLDFKKAAIRAAREAFEGASVEGCAFHLAQAWNRMSKELGLRRFVRGPKGKSITLNRSGEEVDFAVRKLGMRWRSLRKNGRPEVT